ncbi:aminotransferase class V-fold PLP-dependent enzyme [Streptomyces sp. WMMB 322]|uniref:aminotransferase class V-fold PLP-dependent enzyme n=1 Tax=Streptomyces sp. WMMB 322 TaxID=1286821 RepID=UPI0006E3E315|nr:aminotransferase class V-fold PLP-dependent enzyme [Streptomyces sp. WMMB 322]SCK29185.1 Selenocysteine lyase/Cysteine desulfurase [Streptomyces sp. WMMB 322]
MTKDLTAPGASGNPSGNPSDVTAVVAQQPDYTRYFSDQAGHVWLNTAHQGPMPEAAVRAAVGAAHEKATPYRIPDAAFTERPEELRALLADFVGGRPDEIVLGDSTSHGLNLIAYGLPMRAGDEVLCVEGDYPATVLPWLAQRQRGAGVRFVRRDRHGRLDPERVRRALAPRTRVLAVTWVDSFTGAAADLRALGEICHTAGVLLVVNGSQAVGARPVDVAATPVDALVSCGYKWMCGPYGTGFAWLSPALTELLDPRRVYWLAQQRGRGLEHMRSYTIENRGVRGLDVFCPADFLDTAAWTSAVGLLGGLGVHNIHAHGQRLVQRLLDAVDPELYEVVGPQEPEERSGLVVLAGRRGPVDGAVSALAAAGVHVAVREGNIRLSPHLFNTGEHIDRALEVLNSPDD